MARYTDAVCKLCRREGVKLFLKGDRCYTDKCALVRRAYAPGQHGKKRSKQSEYGMQLREKQKARRFYGVLESQFTKYFELASRQKGMTGENLLKILESRLDNIVYRIGLANSRPEARQLVRHGHFNINGKTVDIPSYLVSVGDVLELKDSMKDSPKFKELIETSQTKIIPAFIEFDQNAVSAKIVDTCKREDVSLPVEERFIVEFYSK
ncbi:MAG: 30S ribosomal protein S4 [Clostridia bacterium]|jgi:small subunit ribosomal protein S4|nr:30S ribosomal protein S4 [Clostridia bacterium]NLV33337.1 30S ribosomal protein S4 [Clostridiaceae bacterium]OQB53523.1 MAG: 30S ribosomal protein S4 [Firmicutes bacterium ADurb.Bin146]MDD4502747.1 30S ribosomal protein S4 [Clostridia bacterium]HPB16084.1 30S ribosomal protein S4 [Clostridia bacterium]